MTNLLFMLAMLVVLIFVMVLPQRRKQKAQSAFADELKKGQQVVTMAGVLGRVDKVENEIVTLNVGNKTLIQVTKNSISKELSDALYPPQAAE